MFAGCINKCCLNSMTVKTSSCGLPAHLSCYPPSFVVECQRPKASKTACSKIQAQQCEKLQVPREWSWKQTQNGFRNVLAWRCESSRSAPQFPKFQFLFFPDLESTSLSHLPGSWDKKPSPWPDWNWACSDVEDKLMARVRFPPLKPATTSQMWVGGRNLPEMTHGDGLKQ